MTTAGRIQHGGCSYKGWNLLHRIIMNDLHQEDDLRVLDYDGHHVFNTFSFANLGEPSFHEVT
jgi:hypothetical protein